jgi:hypothetical protein
MQKLGALVCLASCSQSAPATPVEVLEALGEIWTLEERVRKQPAPSAEASFGADPYDLAILGNDRYAGLLRGDDALVLLDASGRELARAATGPSPTALHHHGDELWVASEREGNVTRFRGDDSLPRLEPLKTPATGIRDLTSLGKTAVVASEFDDAVYMGDERLPCPGALEVEVKAPWLIANCFLGRHLAIWRLDAAGHPIGEARRITHDGPFWKVLLHDDLVFATGVENHPLDRSDGAFGFIDSFLYVLDPRTGEELHAINLSELGVVVPKAMLAGGQTLTVFPFGSDRAATMRWSDYRTPPAVSTFATVPGTTRAVATPTGFLLANSLFDRFFAKGERIAAAGLDERAIGELLFFTELLAPWNDARGKRSRFTCETCHYEGGVDGRTHFTGRDGVFATTKPLLGVFRNRPHFSRALDPTTTDMIHNEFRVANRHQHDPWFWLQPGDVSWLDIEEPLSPRLLRRAFLRFFIEFPHRPSPARSAPWSALEQSGAALFLTHCEGCHEARLWSDRKETRQPFAAWPASLDQIVWASDAYAWTGVVPAVHESGARVPSLRRLYKKRPYFTTGSAKTLDEVLAQFAWTDTAYHAQAPAGARRLSPEAQAALRAFLYRL